jgi:quercetin dioxygenase-like cupin family protein
MNSDSNRDLTQLSALWRAPDAGPAIDVLGVTHVCKAMATDTRHQFSAWESIVPPGAGAPAHTHTREDEAFYVLSGEVLVEVEGVADPLRLRPGGFLFGPRNRRHGYRNIGTVTARLLVFAMRAPASIACSLPSTPPANRRHTCRLTALIVVSVIVLSIRPWFSFSRSGLPSVDR